jgi:type II secretory pathway pseudopilin PulG
MNVPDGAVSGMRSHESELNATTSVASAAARAREIIGSGEDRTVMDGPGQGSHGCRRHTLDDDGYLLAVLLVGMAVAAVWMAALLPAWRHQAMREREEELIFRGQQYARAIALYYRKNNQQLPPSVEVLIQGHYLRRKWIDPVTRDEFIYLGAQVPGQLSSSISGTQGRGQRGSIVPPPGSLGGIPPGSGRSSGVALPPPTGPQGQVIPGMYGVQSRSSATSIKVYQGQQQHDLWRFDFREAAQVMGTPVGGGPRGGTPPGRGDTGAGPGRGGPAGPGRGAPGIDPGRGRGPGIGPPGVPPPRGGGSE